MLLSSSSFPLRGLLAGFVASALALAGCAEPPVEEEGAIDSEILGPEGQAIQARVGLHPHNFAGLFDGSNESETAFLDALPDVKAFIDSRIAANGADITVTEAEIAENVISEGGYVVFNVNLFEHLDGFQSFGIDTLVDNLTPLRPWLHQSVLDAAADSAHVKSSTNEQGHTVTTITDVDVATGMYANAGMYAWYKLQVANAIKAKGKDINDLPIQGQSFWATMYYNSGAGNGASNLNAHGVDYYKVKWTRADDANAYSRNAQFNALWRSATTELMAQTIFDENDTFTPPPAPPGFHGAGTTVEIDGVASNGHTFTVPVDARGRQTSITFDLDLSAATTVTVDYGGDLGPTAQLTQDAAAGSSQIGWDLTGSGMGAVRTWTITVPANVTIRSAKATVGF